MIAREITLLPRHWDWLTARPGGVSVTLRRPMGDARRAAEGVNRRHEAQEAVYRFISAMAGNAARLEDAARALLVADATAFESFTQSWPADVRDFAREPASWAFQPQQETA